MNRRRGKPRVAGFYSRREELLNSLTHGLGLLLSVAGMAWLLLVAARHGDLRHLVSFSVYGSSLFLIYLASTLYHGVQHLPAKRRLRVLDHSAIYVFIAGTYTPFVLLAMPARTGLPLLAVVWTMALVGVVYKAFFIHRHEALSTVMYLAMGWLGVLGFRETLTTLPAGALTWLLAGGVAYTAGVFFFAFPRLRYSHAIWHLFVLGGSGCHFVAIAFYLSPAGAF